MTNSYKRMYVLSEEEYQEYKNYKDKVPAAVKCPEDGREFPNVGMLGHHVKSHVNGFRCNICGKVFKTKGALALHLRQHPPQVQPSSHSIFDNVLPTTPQSMTQASKPKKSHKQRSVLNFTTSKWLSLK